MQVDLYKQSIYQIHVNVELPMHLMRTTLAPPRQEATLTSTYVFHREKARHRFYKPYQSVVQFTQKTDRIVIYSKYTIQCKLGMQVAVYKHSIYQIYAGVELPIHMMRTTLAPPRKEPIDGNLRILS